MICNLCGQNIEQNVEYASQNVHFDLHVWCAADIIAGLGQCVVGFFSANHDVQNIAPAIYSVATVEIARILGVLGTKSQLDSIQKTLDDPENNMKDGISCAEKCKTWGDLNKSTGKKRNWAMLFKNFMKKERPKVLAFNAPSDPNWDELM